MGVVMAKKDEILCRNLFEEIQQEARALMRRTGRDYRFTATPSIDNEYTCGKAATLALIDDIQFEGNKLLDSGKNYKFVCEDMDAQMFIEFGGVSSDPSVRREAKKKWKAWKAQFSRK